MAKNKAITKSKPEKSLIVHLRRTGGRNNQGKITAYHRGGGSKRQYRLIDFGQQHINEKGTVTAIEYDPNRNAFIALMEYKEGKKGYLIAPHTIKVGDTIECAEKTEIATGNRMRLINMPVGTQVYNMELMPGQGGKMVRGAGTSAKVLAHDAGYTQVAMPSSEIRKIGDQCFASIGVVSNPEYRYQKMKKAGTNRLRGRRPHVRGSAKNPVDHPHGGGEGRTGIGLKHPKTPTGKPALGVKTRKKKWTDKLIVERRKKKKR